VVVVLCSTDLSHYLTEAEAIERDADTLRCVVELTPERLEIRDACGFFALRGVLAWAKAAECAVTIYHQCTSADTGGTPDRVVGYCAAAVHCHAA
jgi:MEMO1 family protein